MAVMGPVRTLLVAHLQAGWNRSRKELGKSGRIALVLTFAVIVLLAALPTVFLSLAGGYVLGRELPSAAYVRALGGALALLAVLGGLVGGISGGNRVLGWDTTRIFPLRLRSLFTAELIAGLGDLLPLTVALITAFLMVGLGVAKPLLLPFLPLVWLGTVAGMLCIQYLVGSLTARIAKHLKVALMVLGFLLWISTTLLPTTVRMKRSGPAANPMQLKQGLAYLGKVIDVLPSTQAIQGMGEALSGRWGHALGRQIYPLAALMLLLAAAASTLQRDADPHALRPKVSGSKEKLWSFASPVHGIGRLQWQAVIRSHLGKFQLLVPLMVLVLIKGPFASVRGTSLWSVPVAFAYLSMSGMQIQLNQFGLDGSGVKALLLLPVRAADLLLGKTLGLLAFLGVQAMLLLIMLGLLGNLSLSHALAGLCLSGCLFLWQVSLGHWTSAWLPRPMPRDSIKNNNMAQPVIWLGMGAMLLGTTLFGGIFVLTAWLAPSLLVPVMALLLGVLFLIYKGAVLPAAARFLDARKEALVQALE